MKLTLHEKAVSKARPRFNTETGRAYNSQKSKSIADKWMLAAQMRKNGFLRLAKQPLRADLTFGVAMPRSWSTKRKKAFLGKPCITTPDLDNTIKHYFDVLNKTAYEDDAHIAQLWAEKYYAHEAFIEISINPVGDAMIQEHALTIKGEITPADLEYIVKKAHRIGLSGRQLVRVYSQDDEEGKHIYFECEAMTKHD